MTMLSLRPLKPTAAQFATINSMAENNPSMLPITWGYFCNGELAGFTSTLTFVHPRVKNTKKGHRTVVLPDFQGIGLGVYLRDFVAEYYHQKGFDYITTTSNPALVKYMKNSPKCKCTSYGRTASSATPNMVIKGLNKTVAGISRITTSWKYLPESKRSVKAT